MRVPLSGPALGESGNDPLSAPPITRVAFVLYPPMCFPNFPVSHTEVLQTPRGTSEQGPLVSSVLDCFLGSVTGHTEQLNFRPFLAWCGAH